MPVMEETRSRVQPHTLQKLKLAKSSTSQDLKRIRHCLGLLEQLQHEPGALGDEVSELRQSVSEHRWNNLLNNAFLTLDCIEAMLLSDRHSEATRLLPVAIRSMAAIGLASEIGNL